MWFPDVVSLLAGIAAVSSVEDTKLDVRFLPSKLTVEVLAKPDPVIFRVVAGDPAETAVGVILASEGTGFEGGGCVLVELELPLLLQPISSNSATARAI
jgi:hypothetical protein